MCCSSGYSELQATGRMPLWVYAIALTTGKNTSLFSVLVKKEIIEQLDNKAATIMSV